MRQENRGWSRIKVGRRSIAAAAAFLFFFAALSAGQTTAARRKITFMPSRVSVAAEMAETPEERSKGLMYRTSMGELEAMIFSFERSARQTFWMYHTRIPLTVIFLDDGLKIVDIQNMAPCPGEDPGACPVYTSRVNARHAIEVNQGFVEKYRVKFGDYITIGKTGR
jgi:uncharacterized membrane protein (UPF0127 family)